MTRVGATALSLTYAGCGDDGSVEDCTIQWPDGQIEQAPATVDLVTVVADWSGNSPAYSLATRPMPFQEACDALLELVLEQHGHLGWQDGTGGGGELTLTADGGLVVAHYDVVEVHEEDNIVYAPPPKPPVLERPSPEIESVAGTFAVAF